MAYKKWQTFWRVIRSYTLEEKVISIVVLAGIIFSSAQLVVNAYKGGIYFTGEIYTEAFVSNKPTVINPLFLDLPEVSSANRDLTSLIFSGLTRYDPDQKAFVEDLATYALSDDKKTYTFTLKDNVKWHDDEPLTIEDVYFTYHDLIQNPKFQNPILSLNFQGIEVKKVDNKSIQFILQQPNAFFITNTNIGIIPKHLWQDVPITDLMFHPLNLKPVGSGPFKMDNAVEIFGDGKQRIILSSFEDYYGTQSKLEIIRYFIYPDNEFLVKEKSALNIVSKIPSSLIPEFKKSDRFELKYYELPQYVAVFFNIDKPDLKKDRVRLALSKAVDKNELLKVLGEDRLAVDTPLLELNQSEWYYKPSFDEAQGALFDAGYKLDKKDNLRRNANNEVLKLNLLVRAYDKENPLYAETKKVTDFLQQTWKRLGVDVKIEFVPAEVFFDRLAKRDYDMILAGQSLGYNLDTYPYWHSSQAVQNGYNLSNYRSFASSALIENIRNSFTNEEKEKNLKQLAKEIASDVPAIFLYRQRYALATDKKLNGLTLDGLVYPSDRYAHIEKWCVVCAPESNATEDNKSSSTPDQTDQKSTETQTSDIKAQSP